MAGGIVRGPEEVRKIHDLLLFIVAACEPVSVRLNPHERRVLSGVLEEAALMVSIMRWLLGEESGFGEEVRRLEALAHSLQRFVGQEDAVH